MDQQILEYLVNELPGICEKERELENISYIVAMTIAGSQNAIEESILLEVLGRCTLYIHDLEFMLAIFNGMGLLNVSCDIVHTHGVPCIKERFICSDGFNRGLQLEHDDDQGFIDARRRVENLRMELMMI